VSLDFTSQKGTVVIDLDKGRKVTDAKLLIVSTQNLVDSAGKEKRKKVFSRYNRTRIDIKNSYIMVIINISLIA
jgi:hypothetical protein